MFFLVLAVPLSVLPALFLSSILASQLRGIKVFRAIYFIPSVAGVIGVAIIWGQLFQSTVGWINYLIKRAGDILPFVDAPAEGQAWLSSNSTALLAMVIVFAWMSFGFNTVLYLAGHQSIPKDCTRRPRSTALAPGRSSGGSPFRSCATPRSTCSSPRRSWRCSCSTSCGSFRRPSRAGPTTPP